MPAEERTEQPTPKKRHDTRKKGQVAKSHEINSALVLLAGALAVQFFGPKIYEELAGFMKNTLVAMPQQDLTLAQVSNGTVTVALMFIGIMAPVFAIAAVVGATSSMAQFGFVFSTDLIKPKFERINPGKGFKRMFSMRSGVELIKGLVKISIVGFVTYLTLRDKLPLLLDMTNMDIRQSAANICSIGLDISVKAAAVMFVMAIADYVYQRREFMKNLRMTKQEVREEMKQTEGSPQLKARIRQVQRQMAMSRMMQAVPTADVVITNPTHYAVAIKYDSGTMRSPQVIAKGQDLMAQRIKEVAKENNIPIMENKPLAQALYKAVEVGREIPAELYHAVAEVLAFIYGLRGRAYGS